MTALCWGVPATVIPRPRRSNTDTGETGWPADTSDWWPPIRRVRASVGMGPVGSGEVDVDGFVLAAFLDLAALGKRPFVGLGCWLFDHEREAARPEPSGRDDVRLSREQSDVGGQVDPGEQADH